jgi:hypothetical protein
MTRREARDHVPPMRRALRRATVGGMESGDSTEASSHADVARQVDALVDECRSTALWFLRPDYYPHTDTERLRVLDAIQKRADLAAFKRAARLRAWLSRHSSDTSADS